jgi:hypothetical protein
VSTPRFPAGTVPLDLRDRPAWLAGIVLARPGVIFEDEGTGERLRLLGDGRLEPVVAGGHPRPGASHATATTAPRAASTSIVGATQ